jgi:hypothetical protein
MSESLEDIELENKPFKEVKEVKKIKKREFGHYEVIVKKGISEHEKREEKEVVKPITQDDIAEGWQANLPMKRKRQPIHHWSVTLAQLPPHLWHKYRLDYDENGKGFYPSIQDGIYRYSVNETKYDLILKQLYTEMMKGYNANSEIIKDLLKSLENQVNGWLIIRARKYVKESIYNRYFNDLIL